MRVDRNRTALLVGVLAVCLAGTFAFVRWNERRFQAASDRWQRESADAAREAKKLRTSRATIALEDELRAVQKEMAGVIPKLSACRDVKTEESDRLSQAIRDAQNAVDAALEKHPVISAKRAEYSRLDQERVATSQRQADTLDVLQKQRDGYFTGVNKTIEDLWTGRKADEERILKQAGKKSTSELTGDAAEQFKKMDDAFEASFRTAITAVSAWTNDATFAETVRTYKTQATNYTAIQVRQDLLLKEIAAEKIRLRQEDPAIMALEQVTVEKGAERKAYIQASPDFAKYQAEYAALSGKIAKLQRQIAQLRREDSGYPLAMRKMTNQGDGR